MVKGRPVSQRPAVRLASLVVERTSHPILPLSKIFLTRRYFSFNSLHILNYIYCSFLLNSLTSSCSFSGRTIALYFSRGVLRFILILIIMFLGVHAFCIGVLSCGIVVFISHRVPAWSFSFFCFEFLFQRFISFVLISPHVHNYHLGRIRGLGTGGAQLINFIPSFHPQHGRQSSRQRRAWDIPSMTPFPD